MRLPLFCQALFRGICGAVLLASGALAQSPETALLNQRAVSLTRDDTSVAKQVEAFALFEKAEQGGDVTARANLGLSYLLGIGTPRDPFKGGRLLKSAADAGDHFAALAVATTYAGGYGNLFSDNSTKGCRLFEKLFEGHAAIESYYRYSELCSSDPDMQNNFAALGRACQIAAANRHRAALFRCGDPKAGNISNFNQFKAAVDRAAHQNAWYSGTTYDKIYISHFFSDRNDFLIYTIKTIDLSSGQKGYNLEKVLIDRGFKLENW